MIAFPSDIQIAQSAPIQHIRTIAARLGIGEDDLEYYGRHKAKLPLSLIDPDRARESHLILVTAITPTPAGEGKTTMSIGLSDGLNLIGKNAMAVLREPSLGPVFGMKGGAAGGGYAQVIPMEDINLHFTGDFSAIEKANNLLAALIDNHLQNKNASIRLDPRSISWKRVMDMNDRALRQIIVGIGGRQNGVPREDGWKKGSKVLFLDGKGMGMVSMVAENRPNAYMSFRHIGLVRDGVEDTSSEKVQDWAGAMENYTLQEVEGKTLLVVEMDVNEEWAGYFSNTWPLALQRIKSLAEQPA